MRSLLLAIGFLPFLTQATNIILSNDDGWAEINVRTFYDMLTKASNSVVLSAPADNRSGTGTPPHHLDPPEITHSQLMYSPNPRFLRCPSNPTPQTLRVQQLPRWLPSPRLQRHFSPPQLRELIPRNLDALRHPNPISPIFRRSS